MANARWLSKTRFIRGRGFRFHYDRQVHPSRFFGKRPHWQLDTFRKGVKGSRNSFRYYTWRTFGR